MHILVCHWDLYFCKFFIVPKFDELDINSSKIRMASVSTEATTSGWITGSPDYEYDCSVSYNFDVHWQPLTDYSTEE